MIKLQLIGKLAKDATAKSVGDRYVVELNVPINERYKSNGETQERTTWVRASYFVKTDNIVKYLTKGTTVFLEGRPVANAYKTKDGEAKASLDLYVNELEFHGGVRETEPVTQEAESDLPF
jgi:single stranded DNA-binding protein